MTAALLHRYPTSRTIRGSNWGKPLNRHDPSSVIAKSNDTSIVAKAVPKFVGVDHSGLTNRKDGCVLWRAPLAGTDLQIPTRGSSIRCAAAFDNPPLAKTKA
jgi:hypothetical protein